jgi:hypothetical protein
LYSWGWKIVCEDEHLSIPYVGKHIRMLNMDWAKEMPKTLPLDKFQLLFSCCTANLDIEVVKPHGPALRKIRHGFWWGDTDYENAHDAFARLSVVCNHIVAPLKAAPLKAAATDDIEEV